MSKFREQASSILSPARRRPFKQKSGGPWLEPSETMSRKTRCFAIDAAKPVSSSRSLRPLRESHGTV